MPETARANVDAARALIGELAACGVRNVCIAPGSRSTPLVFAVAECSELRDWIIHDERGGAYFALGMARELHEAVAIVSTSGTAAANFLPAVAEASLACVPLIVLTADRPSELRGFGAAQTIDQARIFGSHVRWNFDVAPPCGHNKELESMRALGCRAVAEATAPPAGPVHLNLCFREPLIDTDAADSLSEPERGGAAQTKARRHPSIRVHPSAPSLYPQTIRELAHAMTRATRGLIVCGPRTQGSHADDSSGDVSSAEAISRLATRLRWPILADVLSGLRFGAHDLSQVVHAHDLLLRESEFTDRRRPDFILQFGSLPVSKATSQWLATLRDVRHIVVAEPGLWPDPEHAASDLVHTTTLEFCRSLVPELSGRTTDAATIQAGPLDPHWLQSWIEAGRLAYDAAHAEFARVSELCEAAVPGIVAEALLEPANLSVGNSMPVRDLDSFAAPSPKRIRMLCNRGANGIDGVVSASLGAAAVCPTPLVLVIGDLSFLHDVSALQLAARQQIDMTVVVINNNGGGIFSFLPQARRDGVFERYFATPHGLDLRPIAGSCGARYTEANSAEALTQQLQAAAARSGLDIIEVPSSRAVNLAQHRAITAAARRALRKAFGEAA